MRLQGWRYSQIGEALDPPISGPRVHAIITKLLAETPVEPIEDVRKVELMRLDELQTAIHEKAVNGDQFAIDRVLKIQQQRAQLAGLNAPTVVKNEHMGEGGGPIQSQVSFTDAAKAFDDKALGAIEKMRKEKEAKGGDG